MTHLPAIVAHGYAEYIRELKRLEDEGWQADGYFCNGARLVKGNLSVMVYQLN